MIVKTKKTNKQLLEIYLRATSQALIPQLPTIAKHVSFKIDCVKNELTY